MQLIGSEHTSSRCIHEKNHSLVFAVIHHRIYGIKYVRMIVCIGSVFVYFALNIYYSDIVVAKISFNCGNVSTTKIVFKVLYKLVAAGGQKYNNKYCRTDYDKCFCPRRHRLFRFLHRPRFRIIAETSFRVVLNLAFLSRCLLLHLIFSVL